MSPESMPSRERILATARVVLSTTGLLAIGLDSTEPTRFVALAYVLLASYVVWSFGVLAWLRRPGPRSALLPHVLHAVDLLWASALSLFTSGPSSPFFLFFVFSLTASAFRWGMRGAVTSAAVATIVLVAQSAALAYPGGRLESAFEVNRTIIRSSYLLIMGYLLGFLGESENRHRRESEALVRVLSRLRGAGGLRAMAQGFLEEVRDLTGAGAVAGIAHDAGGPPWLWCLREGVDAPTRQPLPRDEPLTPPPGTADVAFRLAPDGRVELAVPHDAVAPSWRPSWPAGIPRPQRSAVGVSFHAVRDAPPVLLLAIDPRHDDESTVRLLHRVAQEAAPAFENADLLRRLRARAGALERARVARELHDGVLQTLSGLELEVQALRRRGVADPAAVSETLGFIQQQLHAEALTVRELMDAMRPVDIRPGELLEYLTQIVDRFQRATGIPATVVAEPGEVTLPGAACREVVKIVQEALVNVRRHSGATHVFVRVARTPDAVLLVVDDNGRGFPFEGRLEHEALEASRRGPMVMRERVRAIGGRMAIESAPGRGSRVEVRIPTPNAWQEAS